LLAPGFFLLANESTMESAKELSESAKELNNAEPFLITELMASVMSVFEYGPEIGQMSKADALVQLEKFFYKGLEHNGVKLPAVINFAPKSRLKRALKAFNESESLTGGGKNDIGFFLLANESTMESAKELSESAKELNNAEPFLITESMASVMSVFEYGPDFPLSKLSPSLAKSLAIGLDLTVGKK
jgi:uncharacterized protein YciI